MRLTRNATSEASGMQRATNAPHSAASAERAQAFAKSLTVVRESFIARDTSLPYGCPEVYSFANTPQPPVTHARRKILELC
jgi:hypothetical protein